MTGDVPKKNVSVVTFLATGKSFTIGNLGVNDTIKYLQNATNTSPFLIGKIIIIYDDQKMFVFSWFY